MTDRDTYTSGICMTHPRTECEPTECPECQGDGFEPGDWPHACTLCDGTGSIYLCPECEPEAYEDHEL